MAAQRKSAQGAWVVTSSQGTFIENSEIRALRMAVSQHGSCKFVKWGDDIDAPTSDDPAEVDVPTIDGTPSDF